MVKISKNQKVRGAWPLILAVYKVGFVGLAAFNGIQIIEGDTSDGVQRFAGKEGLMAGDQYIGEGLQACKDVVMKHVVGIVFKE